MPLCKTSLKNMNSLRGEKIKVVEQKLSFNSHFFAFIWEPCHKPVYDSGTQEYI